MPHVDLDVIVGNGKSTSALCALASRDAFGIMNGSEAITGTETVPTVEQASL